MSFSHGSARPCDPAALNRMYRPATRQKIADSRTGYTAPGRVATIPMIQFRSHQASPCPDAPLFGRWLKRTRDAKRDFGVVRDLLVAWLTWGAWNSFLAGIYLLHIRRLVAAVSDGFGRNAPGVTRRKSPPTCKDGSLGGFENDLSFSILELHADAARSTITSDSLLPGLSKVSRWASRRNIGAALRHRLSLPLDTGRAPSLYM